MQVRTQSQPGPGNLVKLVLPIAAGVLVAAALFAGPGLFGTKEVKTGGVDQTSPPIVVVQDKTDPGPGVAIGKERPGGLSDVSVSKRSVILQLEDHSAEDGDQVMVKLNGELVAAKITLRKVATPVVLELKPGVNTVEVVALNEGTAPEPYNSAKVQISDVAGGHQVQELRLKMGQTAQFHVVAPD